MLTTLADFSSIHSLAVATSGGSDSMALLLLAQDWAKKSGANLVALTVDHGLRKEAAVEAAQVGQWCVERGIEHHILKASGIGSRATQEDARAMRYQLLTDWCKAHGVEALATGHQRGDQAETLFFRLARGSGLLGLSCIAPESRMHGLRLLRPLLAYGKDELQDYLRAQGQDWIEDASNRLPHYTRNRLRHQLSSLSNAKDIEQRAALLTQRVATIRAIIERRVQQALSDCITRHENSAWLATEPFRTLPIELGRLMLAEAIKQLNGDDFPPRSGDLGRLQAALLDPGFKRRTLAKLIFTNQPKNGQIQITHEP